MSVPLRTRRRRRFRLRLGSHPTAKFFAGGTNLVDLMKLQIETGRRSRRIGPAAADGIEATRGRLRIARGSQQRPRRRPPRRRRSALVQASWRRVTQLRNKATTGGKHLLRGPAARTLRHPAATARARLGVRGAGGINRMTRVGCERPLLAGHPSDMAVAMTASIASGDRRAGRSVGLPDRLALRPLATRRTSSRADAG